ncbi:MAG: hypothetical protein ACLGI6_07955 [Gammaproteobacteria bacterium]
MSAYAQKNRPATAPARRSVESAPRAFDALVNASPRTQRAAAFQLRADRSARVVQLKQHTPADAVNEALGRRGTAGNNGRGQVTDNWIASADQGATDAAWRAAVVPGYVFNTIGSLSGGGAGRPRSMDLKAVPTGAREADFIFHLPVFGAVPDLMRYVIDASGVQRKMDAIRSLSSITVASASDFELTKIRDTPRVDISALQNLPFYVVNKADILAVDPQFEATLANHIGASNASLDSIRTSQPYLTRLANMNARNARDNYRQMVPMVRNNLPVVPPATAAGFAGVLGYMAQLDNLYPTAQALLNDTEREQHVALRQRCAARQAFFNLRTRVAALLATVTQLDATVPGAYGLAVVEFNACAHAKSTTENLSPQEKQALNVLFGHAKALLQQKKPGPADPLLSNDAASKRRGDRDDDEGGGGGGDGGKAAEKVIKRSRDEEVKSPSQTVG